MSRKHRKRAEEDEYWEGAPAFVPSGMPTVYVVPVGRSGVIGFHGKPRAIRAKAKAKRRK